MTALPRISRRDNDLLQKALYYSVRLNTPGIIPHNLLYQLFDEFMFAQPDGTIIYLLRSGFLKHTDTTRSRLEIHLPGLSDKILYGPNIALAPRRVDHVLEEWAKKNKAKLRPHRVDLPVAVRPSPKTKEVEAKPKPKAKPKRKSGLTGLDRTSVNKILVDLVAAMQLTAGSCLPRPFTVTVIGRYCNSGHNPEAILLALQQEGVLRVRVLNQDEEWFVTQSGRARCRRAKIFDSFSSAEKTRIVRGDFW